MAYITKERKCIATTGGFPVSVDYNKSTQTFHYTIINTSGLERVIDSISPQASIPGTIKITSRPAQIDVVNTDMTIEINKKDYLMTESLCNKLKSSILYLEGSVTFLLGTKYRSSYPVEQSHTIIAVVNGGKIVKY